MKTTSSLENSKKSGGGADSSKENNGGAGGGGKVLTRIDKILAESNKINKELNRDSSKKSHNESLKLLKKIRKPSGGYRTSTPKKNDTSISNISANISQIASNNLNESAGSNTSTAKISARARIFQTKVCM